EVVQVKRARQGMTCKVRRLSMNHKAGHKVDRQAKQVWRLQTRQSAQEILREHDPSLAQPVLLIERPRQHKAADHKEQEYASVEVIPQIRIPRPVHVQGVNTPVQRFGLAVKQQYHEDRHKAQAVDLWNPALATDDAAKIQHLWRRSSRRLQASARCLRQRAHGSSSASTRTR